jgi:hypothetical protein
LSQDCTVLNTKNMKQSISGEKPCILETRLAAKCILSWWKPLISELKQFATNYNVFKLSLNNEYAGTLYLDVTWISDDDGDLYVQLKESQDVLNVYLVLSKYLTK